MSRRLLPHTIDPFKLVEQKTILSGQLQLGDMPRLLTCVVNEGQDQVVNDQNTVVVELEFHRDEEGLRVITGRIKGQLSLVCQRCLDITLFQLDEPVALALVKNDEAASQLPSRYDPLLVSEGPVSLITLVEDELLLALPSVAYHDEGECSVLPYQNDMIDETQAEVKKPNPFAVLTGLKK
ncbi:MAG TPA: YceD family protein [Pseudomonadales bacterium]